MLASSGAVASMAAVSHTIWVGSIYTYQNLVKVLKVLLPRFQNALGIVDTAGVSLQTQENLPCCS